MSKGIWWHNRSNNSFRDGEDQVTYFKRRLVGYRKSNWQIESKRESSILKKLSRCKMLLRNKTLCLIILDWLPRETDSEWQAAAEGGLGRAPGNHHRWGKLRERLNRGAMVMEASGPSSGPELEVRVIPSHGEFN